MNPDGKIDEGTAWVPDLANIGTLIAVLERWAYVHGPDPAAEDLEYVRRG